MRWLVGCSLRFRYLVVGLAVALLFFGVQTLGHAEARRVPRVRAGLGRDPDRPASACRRPRSSRSSPCRSRTRCRACPASTTSSRTRSRSCRRSSCTSGTAPTSAAGPAAGPGAAAQPTAPTLPSWCDPPQMYPIVSATSRVMQIGLTSKTRLQLDLSTIAQWTIRPRLMNVPGVANVGDLGRATRSRSWSRATRRRCGQHGVTLDELMSTAANAVDTAEVSSRPARRSARSASSRPRTSGSTSHNIQPISPRRSSWPRCRWQTRHGKLIRSARSPRSPGATRR